MLTVVAISEQDEIGCNFVYMNPETKFARSAQQKTDSKSFESKKYVALGIGKPLVCCVKEKTSIPIGKIALDRHTRDRLGCPINSTCFVEHLDPSDVQTSYPELDTVTVVFPNNISLMHGTEMEKASTKVQICCAAMAQIMDHVVVLGSIKKIMLDGREHVLEVTGMTASNLQLQRGLTSYRTIFNYHESKKEKEKELESYDDLTYYQKLMKKVEASKNEDKTDYGMDGGYGRYRAQDFKVQDNARVESKVDDDLKLAIEQSLKLESRKFTDPNIKVFFEKKEEKGLGLGLALGLGESKETKEKEFDPTYPLEIEIIGQHTSLMVFDPSKSTVGSLLCVIFANYSISDESNVQIKSEIGDLCLGSDDFPTYMSIGECAKRINSDNAWKKLHIGTKARDSRQVVPAWCQLKYSCGASRANLQWPPWCNDDFHMSKELKIGNQTSIYNVLLVRRGTKILAVAKREYIRLMKEQIQQDELNLMERAFETRLFVDQSDKYKRAFAQLDPADVLPILDISKFEVDLGYTCILV